MYVGFLEQGFLLAQSDWPFRKNARGGKSKLGRTHT
jgi:hypothetical protein